MSILLACTYVCMCVYVCMYVFMCAMWLFDAQNLWRQVEGIGYPELWSQVNFQIDGGSSARAAKLLGTEPSLQSLDTSFIKRELNN